MALLVILATATSAYLGAPWWAAILGAIVLLAGSASVTSDVRTELEKHAIGGLVAQTALAQSALHAGAAVGAAFLLGLISRYLWG